MKTFLRTAALLFEKGEYLDIKSGYHHLDIHPDQTRFLGFQWEKNRKALLLSFGLCTTPYVFTKLMKPLIKSWSG